MRTKGVQTPDAILSSDWHYRLSVPVCREDDFLQTQDHKIGQVVRLQEKFGCPILHGGDVFHKWYGDVDKAKVANLVTRAMRVFPEEMFAIPGNHEMPSHDINNIDQSVYQTMVEARRIKTCEGKVFNLIGNMEDYVNLKFRAFGFPYGIELQMRMGGDGKPYKSGEIKGAAIAHVLTYKGRRPFPGANLGCETLMRKLAGYDLILTGDNHKPFIHKKGRQLLVNPGSLTRQRSSETHRPRVYLWYAKTNTVEPYYLQYDEKAVTRKHIQEKEEREDRVANFIDKLKTNVKIDIDFRVNMQRHLRANKNKIDKRTKEMIIAAMED